LEINQGFTTMQGQPIINNKERVNLILVLVLTGMTTSSPIYLQVCSIE